MGILPNPLFSWPNPSGPSVQGISRDVMDRYDLLWFLNMSKKVAWCVAWPSMAAEWPKFLRPKGNLVGPGRRELPVKNSLASSLHYEVDTGELHCPQFHPFRVWRSWIWAGVQLRESTSFGSSTESWAVLDMSWHILAPCPGGFMWFHLFPCGRLWKHMEAYFRVRSFGKRSLVTSQTQRKLWLISSSVSKWRSKEAASALKTQTKSRQTSTDCLFLSSTPANICPESSTGTGQIPAYFHAWAYIMKFWLKVSSKSRFCTTVAVLDIKTKY